MSAPIDPARLELIRSAVEFTRAPYAPSVFRDRADLLTHVDWLNDRLVQAERALAQAGTDLAPELAKCPAVVLYFGNSKDLDDFAELMRQAKPDLIARPVK
jgi:hypothetical protein